MQGDTEPDYRFTLANERTFLAWVRTALAILAGAMVLQQLGRFEPRWLTMMLSCSLAGLSGILSIGAYRQWQHNQRAMRHALPLPSSPLILLLAIAVALLCTVSLLIVAWEA
ncbi:DUF202 domain-containing protein [Variovorax paradoxus]|nr:DUF202 domain-containing protein [Variovorax paradoxus]MBT2304451.1 DUF202 domain-containing protein [Variovorax paradoxus]